MLNPKEEVQRIRESLENKGATEDRIKSLVQQIEAIMADNHFAMRGFVLADLLANLVCEAPAEHRERILGALNRSIERIIALNDAQRRS